ncbi:DNA-binding domain-containing protein [Stigmatella erecta]|uniref:Putative DNA-binding domain-containing protein n=1 Tax=Stigmatella erecta TaxID=83460 RepID=A0A1I0FL73_9BACT|nr:putative DNA-binding domain-containing protein [Stigmatella erecta]SET58236.1 Putative DNA-binding domain-containing protein [Stigmatella erecta]
MKPGLRHFFDAMADFLAAPSGLERLRASHPGWDEAPSRVALYGEFVSHHVRATLAKLYPYTQASVGPEGWTALLDGFEVQRPARHYEMNQLGEGFPAFVADQAGALGLKAFIPALARFEWTDWTVYASEEPLPGPVERLTVNPTLAMVQHPFRLCAWVRGQCQAPAPQEGEEMALLWRHPQHLATWFMPAHDRALLVVKMALEGLSPEAVAEATGVPVDSLHRAVAECVREGFILGP